MNLFTLNDDVWEVLMSYLGRWDALHLALTCRAAYKLALPRFLLEIVLAQPGQAMRFCAFITAKASERAPCLKRFTLLNFSDSWAKPGNEVLTAIARVISLAINIHALSIISTRTVNWIDDLLDACPALADAIAGLHGLDDIRFQDCSVRTLAIMSRMHSRPRTVNLFITCKTDPNGIDFFGPFTRGKDRFLHNLTNSLVTLEIDRYPSLIEELEPDTVWPAVRRLALSGDVHDLPLISRAFPHIRHLHISENLGLHVGSSLTAWSNLDDAFFDNPVPLTSEVRRLEISCDLNDKTNISLEYPTVQMVRNASPVVLSCRPNSSFLNTLAASAPSIRFLRLFTSIIRVRLHEIDETDIKYYIDNKIPSLRTLALKGLALVPGWMSDLEEPNLSEHAAKIAKINPTLEYVALGPSLETDDTFPMTIYGFDYVRFTWFRVVRRFENDLPMLRRLTDTEGKKVHAALLDTPRA
ncbi:uncharacterized protein LAESUDRAFT_406101 [Laetiporus sulphureus 93-53]|uniref:F-box domain-containing protein n=1 Tax=Laetiporus sulphureus 93-53 TaxID=1314785 RepID=A0A165C8Q2_9APHY|nr:uncharacterized protein LAESUDRAFT_406101 [Laetiporus sulphureus 93-53]KZT02396.1 hypothetical protein LAESUDRAFT_406101 [Laetiporus sulphureus 93-53]